MKKYIMSVEVPSVLDSPLIQFNTMLNDKTHREAFKLVIKQEALSPNYLDKLNNSEVRERVAKVIAKSIDKFVESGSVLTSKTNRTPSVRISVKPVP